MNSHVEVCEIAYNELCRQLDNLIENQDDMISKHIPKPTPNTKFYIRGAIELEYGRYFQSIIDVIKPKILKKFRVIFTKSGRRMPQQSLVWNYHVLIEYNPTVKTANQTVETNVTTLVYDQHFFDPNKPDWKKSCKKY